MKSFINIVLVAVAVLPSSSLAESVAHQPNDRELFFPAEKNNVLVFPQRFEYQLIDKDNLKVGNILIDFNSIDFQIKTTKTSNQMIFRWPSGLLNSGEIAIKDNTGRAIFVQPLKKEKIQLLRMTSEAKEGSNQATYTIDGIDKQLVKTLTKYPFFKFCLHREEPKTKIYLCSKDLYIQAGRIDQKILARDSYRQESFVEINGRTVGNQGLIFLNSSEEFISMKTLLLSGATFEVYTRMKPVDYKNVQLSSDGTQIFVKAKGAEPIDSQAKINKSTNEWEVTLDAERPFTYLRGEGDLPLRQEFLIEGSVRKDSVRVLLTQSAPSMTSKPTQKIFLSTNPDNILSPADRRSTLRKVSANEYEWTLHQLELNSSNRRYLKVRSDNIDYVAAYDIARFSSLSTQARLMYPLWLQTTADWHPSQFWSTSFSYDYYLGKSSNETDFSMLTATGMFRFPKGIPLQEPGYLVGGFLQHIISPVKSLQVAGLRTRADFKNPDSWKKFAHWSHVQIDLPLMTADSEFKFKSSYDIEFSLRKNWNDQMSFDYGIKAKNYVLESTQSEIKITKTFGFLGMGWIF